MASSTKATATQSKKDGNKKIDEGNIWASVLKQVHDSMTDKLPSGKQILVLGDQESGKKALIATMKGDFKQGSGLEYHYLNVRDENRDDQVQLGVWVLGDHWLSNLLKTMLQEDKIENTTVLLTASMTTPWALPETLQRWATVLQEHLISLDIPPSAVKNIRQRNLRRFLNYMEPGYESITPQLRTSGTAGDYALAASVPLGEDTLTNNLGLDIIVVITKTDCIRTLEKDFGFKSEHLDFIQQWVRKFCLRYGAALVYTSVKGEKNCDLLHRYLLHRIYGFPFNTPALVSEKDGIFIPSGWDNKKKIAKLYGKFTSVSPDDPYSDVIPKPKPSKQLQPEVVAEDDQAFLARLQAMMNEQPSTPGRATEAAVARTPLQMYAERRLPRLHEVPSSAPRKFETPRLIQPVGAEEGSASTLRNFFTSLLNRQTPGGTPLGTPMSRPTRAGTPMLSAMALMREEAATELDRMAHSIARGYRHGPATSSAARAATNPAQEPPRLSRPRNRGHPAPKRTSD